jgi:hypothetical protein
MAVAALALVFAGGVELQRRARRFQRLADYHFARAYEGTRYEETGLRECGDFVTEAGWLHWRLARKYEYAAQRPWLPVEPDPPQ